MKLCSPRVFVVIASLVLLRSGPVDAADPIVATDLLRLRTVSSIDVARNGGRAVLSVRSIATVTGDDGTPDYAYRSHLYLLDVTDPDARLRQITFGARSDSSPALSPDGSRIAFVRAGETDSGLPSPDPDAESPGPGPQIWVVDVDGGEARQVTNLPLGAGRPRWSPSGRQLLIEGALASRSIDDAGPSWPNEVPISAGASPRPPVEDVEPDPAGSRAELRAWLDANAENGDPVVINRLEFQGEQTLRGPMMFRHLFVFNPDRLEEAPRRITRDHFQHGQAEWMPDGRSIVYVSQKSDETHPDRVRGRSVWMVRADGTDDRVVLEHGEYTYGSPQPSLDGSVLAVIGSQVDLPIYRPRRLGLVPLAPDGASEIVWLTGDERFDASIGGVRWMPSRTSILFTAASRGGFPLFTTGLGLLEPAALVAEEDGHPIGVQTFGVGGGAIVYARTSVDHPCTVHVRDAKGDRQVADLNEWTRLKELAFPERGVITRPDGLEVEYWLMRPTGFDPSRRYPLAVEIHGGPSAMWGPGEFSMWHEFQLLCSWGYGVVYANPRGSGGYGFDFKRANYTDWGAGPAGDVLAVVDQVLLEDWIDENRLVVTGGSYGGYLTAWITAHDHRFKAAVAQRGVYDLATFFGEGNAWRLVEHAMGGLPWDTQARAVLRRESPFTYVNRIRTPLLILHGSQDLRTGVSQSEMLYRALKQLGRPVEYVRYPATGHELSRSGPPRQRLDRLGRIIDFFERFIPNERPAPTE